MTQHVAPKAQAKNQGSTITPTKYVYFFGDGKAEGNGRMKDVLGGKGAGLAEMTNAGLPVPPGFTIQTEACREYMLGTFSPEIDGEMHTALSRLEVLQGQRLGGAENPLLVSVRSGAKFSMPGMMDTILNLGLNDRSVEGLSKRSGDPRFAYDSYRRLIQMFGSVVLNINKKKFEHIFDGIKHREHVKFDYDLKAEALKEIVVEYKKLIKKETGKDFPQDPIEQLVMTRDAVFRSWNGDRAKTYRRINKIDDWLGTAVNVQCMVFGNMGESSGTGVGFTRNPATGEKVFFGEYLMNAQGEDVVSGIRTPLHISELERAMPKAYQQLRTITWKLEKHYRDLQDFEFTIQDGKLYMLQTRNGKRTGLAAVRIAIDMVGEGLITQEEAVMRVEPNQLYDFLVPRLVEKDEKIEVLAIGLPASPGAAVGQIVFSAEDAVKFYNDGVYKDVILVRGETTPEDIAGMEVASGILTSRGGMTSPAGFLPPEPGHFRMAQKNKMFEPHLLIIPLGSTVSFPNLDPFFHNVFSQFNGQRFDLGLYEAGSTRDVHFDHEGVSYLFCNIHPEMSTIIITMSTPWYVVSPGGPIVLPNVPPGQYRLMSGQKARMRSNFVRLPIGCVSALTQIILEPSQYRSRDHRRLTKTSLAKTTGHRAILLIKVRHGGTRTAIHTTPGHDL